MPERISRRTRRHTREQKTCSSVGRFSEQTGDYFDNWSKTEEVLSQKFHDYADTYAPHRDILQEFFKIRISTAGDVGQRTEGLREFSRKHENEVLDLLKPAFVAITQIIKDKKF